MPAGKRSIGKTGAWHPDARATVALAAAATLLVSAGFALLFSSAVSIRLPQPATRLREQLVFSAPSPLPRPVHRHPGRTSTLPEPVPMREQLWPPLQPPISVPGAFTAQDYLRERAEQGAAALREQVIGGDLKRSLGKATDMPVLQDNHGYVTAGGDKVVRSGDSCAQVHTVQGSPSPTNKIAVAEPLSACPGASKQNMGKALQDWAQKHRPPPPR